MYRALGREMTTAERTRAERLVSLLPDCYTLELHKCANGQPSNWKHCSVFNEFFGSVSAGHPDPPDVLYVESHVDALRPCGPGDFLTSGLVVGLAGAALLAGVSVGIMWAVR